MGSYSGDNNANTIDLRGTGLGPGETGNGVSLYGGNDTFYGSAYPDIVTGGDGDDILYGFNGDDTLIGGNGNDQIFGGAGSDYLTGGVGADQIWGDAGNDFMRGNTGNDQYVHSSNTGFDTINEDKNETGATGYGGGTDTLYLGFNLADIQYARPTGSNDLYFATAADFADGIVNDGVKIENFFISANHRMEYLVTADNYQVDLSFIV